ncbi:MAG: alkaline phosphatase family protein [Wenzhouxiangella sp.]|nr:MAG: alkaline phosphatase family protein [Wenzhouxiangella sp.]
MQLTSCISFLPRCLALVLLLVGGSAQSGTDPDRHSHEHTPRLVIGITVDQMRPDYFYRFWNHYGEGGFKRLLDNGFLFRNAKFRHGHTATGPGHAAVYTGTTPRVHGLIGNRWYVPELGREINVVEVPDSTYTTVGGGPRAGQNRAPGNMMVTTIGDELRLYSGERSRTVSVSAKDRAAILSGGHTGDAYWFDRATGNFVTSTFYRDELPEWLRSFNQRGLAREFLQRTWEPARPIETYVESRPDRNPYERPLPGLYRATFPMDLSEIMRQPNMDAGILNVTPFGDELLFELAKTALVEEALGQGETPDMLLIGLSAADIIGHYFGPASKQIQDYYIRLDEYLADFLDFLDEHFERDEILIVITADHGAHYVPQYLHDLRIPTGHSNFHTRLNETLREQLRGHLERRFGTDLLLSISGPHIHLNHPRMAELQLDPAVVRRETVRFLQSLDFVGGALSADTLDQAEFTEGVRGRMMQTYFPARSGDVLMWLTPHTRGDLGTGYTGHGTPWTTDVHVPILFYGYDIPHGQSSAPVAPSDIASTLAVFLNSPFPSGNTGSPLNDLLYGH